MRRKTITVRIDPRVADALEKVAQEKGIAISRLNELILFDYFQAHGEISPEAKYFGEVRGGDRKSEDYRKSQ